MDMETIVFFFIFFLAGLKQNRTSKRVAQCVITALPCLLQPKTNYNDAISLLPDMSRLEKKLRDMSDFKSADFSPVLKGIVALKNNELETGRWLEFLKFECTALGIWCKFCELVLKPYFGYSRRTALRLIQQYSGVVSIHEKYRQSQCLVNMDPWEYEKYVQQCPASEKSVVEKVIVVESDEDISVEERAADICVEQRAEDIYVEERAEDISVQERAEDISVQERAEEIFVENCDEKFLVEESEESDGDSEIDFLLYFDRVEHPQYFINVLMERVEKLENILSQYIDKFGELSDM